MQADGEAGRPEAGSAVLARSSNSADIGAGTEIPTGARENEDTIANAVIDLSITPGANSLHNSFTSSVLAVWSVHRDGHDAVLTFDDQGVSRVSRHPADDTEQGGLQPVPEIQCEAD